MKIQLRILTHGWGNNHLLLAPSLPTVGTYRDGKKESRSKNKELNLGEKILRNQTTAPLFHSMTRVWFYMCSQRNLCNSGLTAGPQEAAYWWKNLKPLLWWTITERPFIPRQLLRACYRAIQFHHHPTLSFLWEICSYRTSHYLYSHV